MLLTTTILGNWKGRAENSDFEEALLAAWLNCQGYSGKIIGKTQLELDKAAALSGTKTLYDANCEVLVGKSVSKGLWSAIRPWTN